MDAGIARYTAYWCGRFVFRGVRGREIGREGRFGLVWPPEGRFPAARRDGKQGRGKARGPPLVRTEAAPCQKRGRPLSEKGPYLGGQRGRRWSDKGPYLFPPEALPFRKRGRPFWPREGAELVDLRDPGGGEFLLQEDAGVGVAPDDVAGRVERVLRGLEDAADAGGTGEVLEGRSWRQGSGSRPGQGGGSWISR